MAAAHPANGASSVPPKIPGHDQMGRFKRASNNYKQFSHRTPSLMPLSAIVGTVTVVMVYFFSHKTNEKAHPERVAHHPNPGPESVLSYISPNMGLDSRDNAGFAERGSISLRAKATENMKARAQAAAHPHDEGHKV